MKHIKASELPFEPYFYEGKTTYLCKICENDWTNNENGICNMCNENLEEYSIPEEKYKNYENIEIIDDRPIHPCGDCIYYGEKCMKHMEDCDYSDKEILK